MYDDDADHDDYHGDEFHWAAIELYLATGDISYYDTYNVTGQGIYVPNWASNQNTYGIISLLLNKDKLTGNALSDYNTLLNNYTNMADNWVSVYRCMTTIHTKSLCAMIGLGEATVKQGIGLISF